MAGKPKLRLARPQGVALWAPVTALLLLGMFTTIIDLTRLPNQETARANEKAQRFVVDPGTGIVSMGTGADPAAKEGGKVPEAFDVGEGKPEAPNDPSVAEDTKPEASAEKPEPTKPEELKPADVKPEATKPAEAAPVPAPVGETKPATAPAAESKPEPAAVPETKTTPAAEAPAPAPAEPAHTTATDPSLPADTPTLRTTPITADFNTIVRTKDSLVSAPAPEVTQRINGLSLPKRGDKDVIPSQLYAHPFKRKPDEILISFVVIDAGLDPQSIGLLMSMPPEITVAYSPYTRVTSGYSENLRAAGHEVWTMLPTMTDRYPSDDPGPMGIIARMPDEEIMRRFYEVLSAIPGSVGIVLPPDETITNQKNSLSSVLADADKRGLFVLSTHPTHSVEQLTSDKKLADIIRRADLILDPTPNEPQIRSKLAGLLDSAKEKGEYMVVLNARPQSLRLLMEWLRDNPLAAPYTLAPVSAFYQPKIAPEAPPAEEEGHGAKKEKPKPKPVEKKKVLPQDQYKQPPAGEKKEGGGHH